MRLPWRNPHGAWSWTTLWLNIACLVTVVRYAVGAEVVVGALDWKPGELDAGLVASILTTIGGLYWGRRWQEGQPTAVPVVPAVPALADAPA